MFKKGDKFRYFKDNRVKVLKKASRKSPRCPVCKGVMTYSK